MAPKRQPTYRASLEGADVQLDLRELMAELDHHHPQKPTTNNTGPSLPFMLHPSPSRFPFLLFRKPPNIGVTLTSSHRTASPYPNATTTFRVLPFSKQALLVDLLGVVDVHGKADFRSRRPSVNHLEIDLHRPVEAITVTENPPTHTQCLPEDVIRGSKVIESTKIDFPLQDLAPLTLFHQLTYFKLEGMMQSYQSQIWQCVWLNPRLHTLILSMSIDGELLSSEEIRVARLQADFHPNMRQACHGHLRAYVPEKLPIVKLELTNFIVSSTPFEWFDGKRLQHIRFVGCTDAGFRLVGDDWMNTTVVTVPGEEKAEQTSMNLMSPRRRHGMVDNRGMGWGLTGEKLAALRDM